MPSGRVARGLGPFNFRLAVRTLTFGVRTGTFAGGDSSFPKPLHVLDKDVAIWTSQTLFGNWTGISELNISPRRRIKLRPLR